MKRATIALNDELERAVDVYFESIHGTAPDIKGLGIINPTATMLSAVLMLDYLGFGDKAKRSRMRCARSTPRAKG
jgi:isocitrate/isopropylmalate dehydrogenase